MSSAGSVAGAMDAAEEMRISMTPVRSGHVTTTYGTFSGASGSSGGMLCLMDSANRHRLGEMQWTRGSSSGREAYRWRPRPLLRPIAAVSNMRTSSTMLTDADAAVSAASIRRRMKFTGIDRLSANMHSTGYLHCQLRKFAVIRRTLAVRI